MSNIQKAIDEYLNVVSATRSANTHKAYQQALKTFADLSGDSELTPATYLNFLLKTREMSASTQNTYRVAVMGLYLYYATNHPEVNIAALRQYNRQYAKRKGERLPTFDRDAIEKLIAYCSTMRNGLSELRDRAFVLTLADTGLRISEACALRRGDIDWQEGQAMIIGKGNKQAVIRFSNRALDAMRDYLAERAALDGTTKKPLSSLPLFARHDKGAGKKVKPVKSGGMWATIKERATEAGIDPKSIRVHDLRHYFITLVQLAGGDIRLTQELARHQDIRTTGRYAHMGGRVDELYNRVFNES